MRLGNATEHQVAIGDCEVRAVTAGAGSPTVLFDAALGTPLEAWSAVAPTIAARHRVILWDRPGIGRSGPHVALDAEGMADAMASVVRTITDRSVIVVAHSRGGIHALAFATFHPHLVAGLVLVEPSHPDQLQRMPNSGGGLLRVARVLAKAPRPVAQLPAYAIRLIVRARGDRARPGAATMAEVAPKLFARLDGLVAEHNNGPALLASVSAAIADRGVPDVPLAVLTGDLNYRNPADQAAWDAMHAELAGLSSRGQRVHVRCGHEMPFSNPEVIIDAITRISQQDSPS